MAAKGSTGVGESLLIVLVLCLGVLAAGTGPAAAGTTTAIDGPVEGVESDVAQATADEPTVDRTTANETIVVDPGGDGDYTAIQPAVDEASEGDAIEVMPGTYDENVVVDKTVTITAPQGATMRREEANDLKAAFQITVSGTPEPTIRGFTIRNYNLGVGGAQGDAAWVIEDMDIESEGSAAVFAPESAGDWRAHNVTTTGGKHGFDVRASTGDWLIEDSTVTESNSNGIWGEDSEGDWTVRNTTVATNSPGVVGENARGNWTVEGSEIRDTGGAGVLAFNSSGAWRVANTSVRGSYGPGVDAVQAGGNWTIENATIEHNDAGGVAAGLTTGAWTVTNSTIGQGAFFGVTAFESEGDWSVTGTTIRNRTGVAVFAERAAGDWRVRDSTIREIRTQTSEELPSEGVAVFANATTGPWAVHNTSITATDRPGINATDAGVRGDATGNWWGQLSGAEPDDCVGNVTCGEPLRSPPGGPVGDSPSDYAGENGVVETVGVRVAVDDWRQGHADGELLLAVIDAWSNGEPVA